MQTEKHPFLPPEIPITWEEAGSLNQTAEIDPDMEALTASLEGEDVPVAFSSDSSEDALGDWGPADEERESRERFFPDVRVRDAARVVFGASAERAAEGDPAGAADRFFAAVREALREAGADRMGIQQRETLFSVIYAEAEGFQSRATEEAFAEAARRFGAAADSGNREWAAFVEGKLKESDERWSARLKALYAGLRCGPENGGRLEISD